MADRTHSWRSFAVVALSLALAVALTGCGLVASDYSTTSGEAEPQRAGLQYDESASGYDALQPASPDADTNKTLGTYEYAGAGEDASAIPSADRLVVRTVNMRVRVDDVAKSIAAIRDVSDELKGIVTDLQVSTDDGDPVYRYGSEADTFSDGAQLSGYVTVRVPAAQLETFLTRVGKLGKILRQAENEDDVTQEHVDLNARLANLQATEKRLREFLDDAKNVTEMLAVEAQLSSTRGEIESMQAQISYMERQAAMSTVTIELQEPAQVVRPAGEDWGFNRALTSSVRAFVGTINGMIVVFGGILPVLLVLALVVLVVRAVFRRRGSTSDAGAEQADDTPPPAPGA